MAEKISNSRQRLQEMMQILSLKQSDIVSRTGINKSGLSNYIHGTREPRQDQISKIADPYGINPAWLMGYDVPMFIEEPLNIIAGLSDDEEFLVNILRNGTDNEKKLLVDMVSFFKKNRGNN